MDQRGSWTKVTVVFLVGFLGWYSAAVVGKLWYYVKVVRTVERVLKANRPPIEIAW